MRLIFHHSPLCSLHTSSINVAGFGYHRSKKPSAVDMTSSYELFSPPLLYKTTYKVIFFNSIHGVRWGGILRKKKTNNKIFSYSYSVTSLLNISFISCPNINKIKTRIWKIKKNKEQVSAIHVESWSKSNKIKIDLTSKSSQCLLFFSISYMVSNNYYSFIIIVCEWVTITWNNLHAVVWVQVTFSLIIIYEQLYIFNLILIIY